MANSQALVSVPPMPPAPVQGGSMVQSQMMQPGMMQPAMMQQMLMQQQMMMNPMMMQQGMPPPAPPGGKAPDAGDLDPSAPKEVRKKHVEYQRLIKKGNNAETVFIGGLRKTTDEDQVAAHFAKFGQVEKVEIKRQPDGTSRGFAFVKFQDQGAVDKVIASRAQHMIDNKWIDVKRHNGVAACAGRAASLAKPEEPKEEEPDQEDLEDKWTQQYLTMAQQYGKLQDTSTEDQEDDDHPQQQQQQPMMAMQPMMMPMPMMAMPPNMPMAPGGAPPKDGNSGASQEPMVTGFMTVDANALGIRGGPPGMMVGVPMLSNGQPAVNIPGFNPGMMNSAPGGCGGPPGQAMNTAPGGCGPVGSGPVAGGPVAGAPLALPPGPPPPPAVPPGPGSFQAVRPGGPGMARPGPYQT
mmetsp:Transcript_18794/g.34933  ORF Transcript_18794/g.34933 Transcript_18794/m.34933 type:complete len:408 (+) Transcript_18794:166-1389(+)